MNAYEGAINQASAVSRINMEKMEHYTQVKQGVKAFNSANETGNYIRDGLKTASNVGTEIGIAAGKKMAAKGLEKVAGVVDRYRGTEGGMEGLSKRMTSRFTSIQRAKIQNAKNLRQNQRVSNNQRKPAEKEEEEEDEDIDYDAPDALEDAESKEYFKDVPDDQLSKRVKSGDDEVSDTTGRGGASDAKNELNYRKARDDALGDGEDAEGIADGLGEAAGEALGEGGAELAGETIASIGLDALDATGIGAVVGIPLQIAMAGGMVASGVELGENLWSDFKDIFKHGADRGDETAPTAPVYNTNIIAPTLES